MVGWYERNPAHEQQNPFKCTRVLSGLVKEGIMHGRHRQPDPSAYLAGTFVGVKSVGEKFPGSTRADPGPRLAGYGPASLQLVPVPPVW